MIYFRAMAEVQFVGQTSFYSGKVRDVYYLGDRHLVMIASDRISAFDVILPEPIPFKGQVLNQVAAFMLRATSDICPNWLIDTPSANSSIGFRCEPVKVEVVVRGSLCGHAWRTYQLGLRELCGAPMPDGMKENDFFPAPIITPSTKASVGHDEDISEEEIIHQELVSQKDWQTVTGYALQLFQRGQEIAGRNGLILADTKYEFGISGNEIVLMDEIHTPDSSRYFYSEGFEERQKNGEKQKQLSKEFVREWLIENNFMGKQGQTLPVMSKDWVNTISGRYIELFEKVTGSAFKPEKLEPSQNFDLISRAIEKLDLAM